VSFFGGKAEEEGCLMKVIEIKKAAFSMQPFLISMMAL
jgi:hypothetical protein